MKYFLVSLIFIKISHANCLRSLRFIINPNFQLSSLHLQKYYQYKNLLFDLQVGTLGPIENIISSKRGTRDRRLQEVITKKLAGELNHPLAIIREAINNPNKVKDWIENLHKDVVFDIYSNNLIYEISIFEKKKMLHESSLIRVLLDRSIEGGFSGKLNELLYIHEQLDIYQFSSILRKKRLFIDEIFRDDSSHGHLVHILHVDFMIFAIKKASLNPMYASDLYQWFGQRVKIEVSDDEYRFDSLKSGWANLFDAIQMDLTSPERLSPILNNYFRLY